MSDPFDLDFAALRCFHLVHSHGSFSRAADSLGVSQSSVSYTIARLREVFGDPLFVRQGGGIVPTQRCEEIVHQTARIVDEFEALAAPRVFDPQSVQISVGISCNFYERVTILPELIRILRSEAPGLRLRIIPSQVRGHEHLVRGEADLLIGPIRIPDAGYYRRTLLRDHYVCIMDPAAPLRTALSMSAYVAAPQIVVNYGGTFRSPFLVELEQMGQTLNAVVEVPSPADLPRLLKSTDMIATVPSRVADVFGDAVRVVPCPVQAEIKIDLHWTPRTHASAAHGWLRDKIAQAATQVQARKT